MASLDPSAQTNDVIPQEVPPPEPPPDSVAPPVGVTPPEILARDAARGRRGAAWRLLYWVIENDPRAFTAIASCEDDRLAKNLLEFIAVRTWAGKPFVVPPPIRTAYARTQLRTLFLPRSGMDPARAERVLLPATKDPRPAVRETAVHILGIIGSPVAGPRLTEALEDPAPGVRLQAAKALGRVRYAAAVPVLINALRGADEQLGSQIFTALVKQGPEAIPALTAASSNSSPWVRWHCMRALSEGSDASVLPILVKGLSDPDYSVAWMSAKGLVRFGKPSMEPVLRLLINTETTPWLVQTASFVLSDLYTHDSRLKPYLEPVVQSMHGVAYQIATPLAAQKALAQLEAEGLVRRQ